MNNTFSFLKPVAAAVAISSLALAARAQTVSPFALPLYFEANKNQTEFLSSGSDYQFFISPTSVQIALRESSHTATARMEFVGANAHAQIRGLEALPDKVNYLIGNDPSQWQTGLATFPKVRVSEIYPGINLVFHGNQRRLEYDFAVHPGANPNAIKIRFSGVDRIYTTSQGDLVLKIGGNEICQPAPEIYQTTGGTRKIIGGGYKILDARTVAFETANYDHSLPLVIDPMLNYSSFFGGNLDTIGWAIALGTNDCVYVAGQTMSKGFFTSGAVQTNYGGGTYAGDAFVAKLAGNPATNLIYLTYLGGKGDDAALGLAVNPAGNAFVTGYTESTNFPVSNAIPGHAKIGGKIGPTGLYFADAFVTELSQSGSNLIYSTYLGGESADSGYGIALDSSNDVYVTGFSYSTNFPVTPNAMQSHLLCSNNMYVDANAFVSEITNGGGALVYSTYLGGTNYDVGRAIALDTSNDVYVAGYTASFNFPVWHTPTNFPSLHYLNGATNAFHVDNKFDGFVTKFPPLNGTISPSTQTNAFYSTFLGGTNNDLAYGIAVDGAGNAYVTGWTCSTNFPITNNPSGLFSYVTTNGTFFPPIATNAFLTKISADGRQVMDSTVFGGRSIDIGYGVAVDAAGDAFVVGTENSTNFPTMNTSGSLMATNTSRTGVNDAFVAAFNADWSTMYYSVCLGGKKSTFGCGIALDSATNVFITGLTSSTNFPTQNASRFWFNGTNFINGTNYINGANLSGTTDAFVTEISLGPVPMGPDITNPPVNVATGVGDTASFSVGVSGSAPLIYQWQLFTNGNWTNLANGHSITGVTSNVLTITDVQTNNAGNYKITVTNDWGSASATASLAVSELPIITVPLTNQTVLMESTVTFALTAYGTPTLHYQWLMNGMVLTNGGQFSGATTNILTLTDAQVSNSGTYEVIITNDFGSTNDSAILTVPVLEMTLSLVSNNITNGLEFNVVGGPANQKFYLWTTSNLVVGPIAFPAWTNPSDFYGDFDSQGQVNFTLTPSFLASFFPTMTNWPQAFFTITSTN